MAYSMASPFLYVAGVYNGPAVSANPSHRAAIPNPQLQEVPGDLLYAGLNLRDATYTRVYQLPGSKCFVTQVLYAHRDNTRLLVQSITVDNSKSTETCFLELDPPTAKSSDLSAPVTSNTPTYTVSTYSTLESEVKGFPLVKIAVVSFIPDQVLNVLAGQTQTSYFYTTVSTSLDSPDPTMRATQAYNDALSDEPILLAIHSAAWAKLWNSRIDIGGNLDLAQVVNSSYYYMLSSLHENVPWSISPGALASNGYNGHMFWDAETWMYPPILFFHPWLAEATFLRYRLQHIDGARMKAKSYNKGYQGTMYPWESASSGIEVCPTTAPTGLLEQHISGDIALATRQYYYATGDPDFVKMYKDVIEGIGKFWISRVQPSSVSPGAYKIDGVIPPDEYAVNINNSAYTNFVAKISLDWMIEADSLLNVKVDPAAEKIARGLLIPFDPVQQIHLEFDGYKGQTIKQADVVMLGFPLEMNMSRTIRKNDLEYYESRTDSFGPAMTWAMHAIGWLELNEPSRAASMFTRAYANSHKPFGVWTETPLGGTTNFVTGAGGFLQALINGYGGARLSRFAYSFAPVLPPNTSFMALKNFSIGSCLVSISWDSSTITVEVGEADTMVTLTLSSSSGNVTLHSGHRKSLSAGSSFKLTATRTGR